MLSGGQRQRVAIARAMVRAAPIIILDEPLTGLDVGAEKYVREALSRLTLNKTCLVITHKIETALMAGRAYYLEEGQVFERSLSPGDQAEPYLSTGSNTVN